MKVKLFLIFLIIVGFFYRLYGLDANLSFWSDEAHVAIFTRAISERGRPVLLNGFSTDSYQWLQYWLGAFFVKIFGLGEFAIRFPSILFGTLTIWAVYLLGKELFSGISTPEVKYADTSGVYVPLVAAIFTAFLKIEILWSRQARPYQALQFFYLLIAYFIHKMAKEKKFNWAYFLGFLVSGILASLIHGMGLIVLFTGFLYFSLFYKSFLKKWLPLGVLIGLSLLYLCKISPSMFTSRLGKLNNLSYYRVFLWHNYSLLFFLALIGFLSSVFRKKNNWQMLTFFLGIQGMIVAFLAPQPFVRYLYIVFPFFILLSAVGLDLIVQVMTKKLATRALKFRTPVLFLLTFFMMASSSKFSLFPQETYSLNEDMQEIPEVDWKKIYGFVGSKLKDNPESVLVSNWNDLSVWYLGEGKLGYLLREKFEQKINQDPLSSAVWLDSLEMFANLVQEKKSGILVVDSWDDQVPEGIRDYCRQNLRKELEVDRLYPVQPRYWPVEVYSWGI